MEKTRVSNTVRLPRVENVAVPRHRQMSTRGMAWRLFFTCWLIYALHFATNIPREIYPALALGDHLSFRVDEYANMHPDLFETPGYGWHINNNPGVSMLAAVPYALARPAIDTVVGIVNQRRAASGLQEPPSYSSPWPMAREFYATAWRRGYDIKFGMAAFVMQVFAMAPITALSAVVMFYALRILFASDLTALGLALLYAFGTPVFFRTGYLNHNLMLGIFAFMGFVAMWNPGANSRPALSVRYFLGGVAGGTALLFDYSGVIFLAGLFIYGVLKQLRVGTWTGVFRPSIAYILGAVGPIGLLWFYQWASFGNPFLPAQFWMPNVAYSDMGYRGYALPQLDLLRTLAVDYRTGLFTSCPLLLLGLAAPFLDRGPGRVLAKLELGTILGLTLAAWVFFSGNNYTRLEFNTGIRYLTAIIPFFFIPTAVVLMRLPRFAIYFISVFSIVLSWSLAMYRDVERGFGLLEPLLHVFTGGLQLPWLTTLSRMGSTYGDYFAAGVSPLPILLLVTALLFGLWVPYFWTRHSKRAAATFLN
ncbi:MAG: hypothetical protein IT331_10420 [Anaerolineae bacterium]|nr:hypothetical protein [Anaerolineae bacterium]